MDGRYTGETARKLESGRGQEAWRECLERLRREVPPSDFDALLRPLQASDELDAGSLILWAPNRYVQAQVDEKYRERIAHHALVDSVRMKVGSRDREHGAPRRAERGQRSAQPAGAAGQAGAGPLSLNPAFTFANFVEGRSNEFAKAAASQVAASPGQNYNPLLLYGGVGLGKTHLTHAVGNAILANNPQAKVAYLQSERFVDDMVRGIRNNNVQDVMLGYRMVDVLLIDDIQFFARRVRTQEQFFQVFNAVIGRRGQIVLTSDKYPRQIDGLDVRLQSRFVGGMTTEVEPPDLETRVAILQSKAEAEGVGVSDDSAFFIANHIQSNVRELEGALRRVVAHARFDNTPVTVDLVKRALRDLLTIHSRQITVDHIQRVVADYYKIRQADMLAKGRSRAIARPRQMAMSLAKQFTNNSYPDIGGRFGGRDHTTVLYACRKIRELRKSDADLAEDYENLIRLLNQ